MSKLPNSWQHGQLSHFFGTVTGSTPPKREKQYYGADIPFVKPPELLDDFITETADNLSNQGASVGRVLPPNSVLVSCIGNLGKVGLNIVPVAFNQQINAIVPSENAIPEFMFYQVLSPDFIDQLHTLASGTTVPIVNKSKFNSINIVLPLIPEQKRIVAILDEAFAGISQAVANAEKNLDNARELFESYLNNVFTQKSEGWVESPLEEHIRFIDYRGRTPKKTEAGLRLITAKNVRMGFLQREPEEFVAPDTYDSWMTRGIPKKGDVLFTTEAPLGLVCQLDTEEKVVFAQRIITMQTDRKIVNPAFLSLVLRSNLLQTRIHEKGTGATVKGIKASLLKKITFPLPSLVEQKAIVDKLQALSLETKCLEVICQQKLTALTELKQSILQKAFAGELATGENKRFMEAV